MCKYTPVSTLFARIQMKGGFVPNVDLIEMKRQRNLTIVFPADCENNKY